MDEIRTAALELAESIRRLSIAEAVKEDMIKDILMIETLLAKGEIQDVQRLVAGLNGSMIAFLDYEKLMTPYGKWKRAVGAAIMK